MGGRQSASPWPDEQVLPAGLLPSNDVFQAGPFVPDGLLRRNREFAPDLKFNFYTIH